ncbi:MAG: MerR family transcriptional regulator [Oscillospiraceae bacterium]|nr:MerR family transcriptional regulator [Oscillospiraceae bacterium]
MTYSTAQLAQLAGVSARTLRYYDGIGLLRAARADNGYRTYGADAVDTLQQILFYRALGLELCEIKKILSAPDYDRETALRRQRTSLCAQRDSLDKLIRNIDKTLGALKGDTVMTDSEKFEGFKERMLRENEEKYGAELQKKYGAQVMEASREKFGSMSEEKWLRAQEYSTQFSETLKRAMESGDPAGEAAQRACELHGQWLRQFWPDGMYTKQAHRAMADMYVADERFAAYYDEIEKGAAEFLRDALAIYCA